MSRLPFDPQKAAGSPARRSPADRKRARLGHVCEAARLTVSELAQIIKSTLESHIPSPLRVIGEVSNLSRPNHWYFSLKDDKAVVSCVAWASSAAKFGFVPSDGDEVVATGEVSHYGPQGKTQLYVRKLEPVGAGALELKFRAMCDELRKLGYFDESHKKSLPVFPRRIAVITSAGGAAVHDVIDTARRRCPAVGLLIVDVKVQGEGAAEQIARAIRWVDKNAKRLHTDAVLVTRGGGSMEDLWAFNERIVADATYECRLPIVAAIGHESDTTVIELVADVRAATPTQATMRLVPDAANLRQQVDHLHGRVNLLTFQMVDRGRRLLDAISRHAMFRRTESLIDPQRQRVDALSRDLWRGAAAMIAQRRLQLERLAGRLAVSPGEAIISARRHRLHMLGDRMERAVRQRWELVQQRIEQLGLRLRAVDPHRVLERGYTITFDAHGRLIRSAAAVRRGQTLLTQFHDGRVTSTTDDSSQDSKFPQTPAGSAPSRPSKKPKGRDSTDDQLDLFSRRQ